MPAKTAPTFETAQKKLWRAEAALLAKQLTKQQRETAKIKKAIRKDIAAAEKQAKRLAARLARIEQKEPAAAKRFTSRINLLRGRVEA